MTKHIKLDILYSFNVSCQSVVKLYITLDSTSTHEKYKQSRNKQQSGIACANTYT